MLCFENRSGHDSLPPVQESRHGFVQFLLLLLWSLLPSLSLLLLSLLFVTLSHLSLHVHDEYSACSVAHHKLFRIPRHHVN